MKGAPRLAGAALLALAAGGTVQAQDQVLDRGTFTITRQGVVIGRETFVLRRGTMASGGPGLILTATATYPPDHAGASFTAQAEYGPDSVISQLQLDETAAQRRFLARFLGRRITVRIVTPATESAREYPLAGRTLAVHDSLFSLYTLLRLAPTPDTLTVVSPTIGRRGTAVVTAGAADSATVGGTRRILKHVILSQDEDVRHLWYDDAGRLTAIEVPHLGLRAQR